MWKLHCQFAHLPKECLTALLKDAIAWKEARENLSKTLGDMESKYAISDGI